MQSPLAVGAERSPTPPRWTMEQRSRFLVHANTQTTSTPQKDPSQSSANSMPTRLKANARRSSLMCSPMREGGYCSDAKVRCATGPLEAATDLLQAPLRAHQDGWCGGSHPGFRRLGDKYRCLCRARAKRSAGQLVHGPGGLGKTRLLIRLRRGCGPPAGRRASSLALLSRADRNGGTATTWQLARQSKARTTRARDHGLRRRY